ncbi:hypothetical protein GGX14DRAFT_409088 [Mycena pura]|uniref:Uncharacterized protein n=1 Tax=Mycena pura TaxID=153505 RepID=A0AAD6UMZ3_9AGAR|nr:hypothetical protein GGX14DRAFT_409088 [Mycena pura]
MFNAADISRREIMSYRSFAFPSVLGDPSHDPFFSVEDAVAWITSRGYQLYLEQDDSIMISENYISHSFFSLDNTDFWINHVAFDAYMKLFHGSFNKYRTSNSTPFSSRAPSRAASSPESRAPSRADSSFSLADSRPSSRASFMPSLCSPSVTRSSSPASHDVIEIFDSDSDDFPVKIPTPLVPKVEGTSSSPPLNRLTVTLNSDAKRRKGKHKAEKVMIQLTRQESVNDIVEISTIPSTWTVPRVPTAYLIDLSNAPNLLEKGLFEKRLVFVPYKLVVLKLTEFKDQDSWGGSSGHATGDAETAGFFPDLTKTIRCRRCHFECNGVYTCQFFDSSLFADCERYEPDEAAMRELWRHELDANEREAASAPGLISQFYTQIMQSKCKAKCDGVPILKRLSNGTAYGKTSFVGCSKWTSAQRFEHRYLPIPNNVDEELLQFAMQNGGRLPTTQTVNEVCALTVHPRIGAGLHVCPYSHIIEGQMKAGQIVKRKCPTRMIIFIPIDKSTARHKALVILRNPHNHPMHPKTKPSSNDRRTLATAVEAAGVVGLTVGKLLTAACTSLIYNGDRLAATSPAFMDSRKLRDAIIEHKKKDHPRGMGWEGVLHHFNTKELSLPKSERYIHTAMFKNGFRLVVTLHPQIAMFIHQILSLNIDYTFKRVDGITFASLFCDTKTHEAFTQLFIELFDTIAEVTGQRLKLAPFYPDAKCRIVMLDGEVPQAQGLGAFLVTYNDPEISGIHSRNPIDHIDELPREIPRPLILRLKSMIGLNTQQEIDDWHSFCAAQVHPDIKRTAVREKYYPGKMGLELGKSIT